MANRKQRDIEKLLGNRALVRKALAEGVREALLRHKQAGLPVVQWRDGKVVWIPPEEIVVNDEGQRRRESGRRSRCS